MPSIFQGCSFTDETSKTLADFYLALGTVEQGFNDQVVVLAAAITELSAAATSASRLVGTLAEEQILWTAVQPGAAGNEISVSYLYRGPELVAGILQARAPGATVQGTAIFLWLGCDASGTVVLDTAGHLAVWAADSAVSGLVQGVVQGLGTAVPTQQPLQYLQQGKDSPVPAADAAAHDVARVFGRPDYLTLLRDLDVPVVSSDAEARALLNENDHYCVVNGHLLIISGTNLTGFNQLWTLYGSVAKLRTFAGAMQTNLPRLITTQMVTTTSWVLLCGQQQPVSTVVEVLRDVDVPVNVSVVRWGAAETLRHYCFWDTAALPTTRSYETLKHWGFPEQYLGALLAGESPVPVEGLVVTAPTCWTVEDRTLLTRIHFTDAEAAELLALQVPGIKVPATTTTKENAVALAALQRCRGTRTNGARSAQRCSIATLRTVKPALVFNDSDLSSELATRGRACARLSNRALLPGYSTAGIPDVPGVPGMPDLPNADFSKLPDPAKKIESAFAALSSAISAANQLFDRMVGAIVKTVMGMLDKIQNLMSLAENLLKNPLTECLLGVGTAATGSPEFGSAGGSSVPSITSLTGGLPLPMSALALAFSSMSTMLDKTITQAFSLAMKSIETPLCLLRAMLDTIAGVTLGGLDNPCKKPVDNCPVVDVQATIDASPTMTATLAAIPALEGSPTTLPVETTTESVQSFTGLVQKSVQETTAEVTRGVQGIISDFQESVNSKTKLITEFEQKVKELFRDLKQTSQDLAEASARQSTCGPPALGPMMDQITKYM
jgi:hypothetical protein